MATKDHTTRLVVLMFTDLAGSVDLKTRLGSNAYARIISRHDSIFKHILASIAGSQTIKDTGDGFLARFETASDAARAALCFQRALRQEAWEGQPLRARIGLHIGEVSEIEKEDATGRPKIVGLAADIAARLMDLAAPGQILMSRTIYDDARQYIREHPHLKDDPGPFPAIRWLAHGPYLFGGSDNPMDVFEVGAVGEAPLKAPANTAKARRVLPNSGSTATSPQSAMRRFAIGAIAIAALLAIVIFFIISGGTDPTTSPTSGNNQPSPLIGGATSKDVQKDNNPVTLAAVPVRAPRGFIHARPHHAEQLIGPPNVPEPGSSPLAWSHTNPDDQPEWIVVDYANPIDAKSIHIYENEGMGALVRVTMFDDNEEEIELWAGVDPVAPKEEKNRVAVLEIHPKQAVRRIKLYLDSPRFPGWHEIDAVGLKDGAGQLHWAAGAYASTVYCDQDHPLEVVPPMKRIDQVAGDHIDLLKSIADRPAGPLRIGGRNDNSASRFFDVLCPDEYSLEFELERDAGSGHTEIVLLIAGRTCVLRLSQSDGSDKKIPQRSGLGLLDGNLAYGKNNPTATDGISLRDGESNHLFCEVRSNSIKATLNGKLIIDWQGDPARLSPPATIERAIEKRANNIGLFQWSGHLRCKKAILRPLDVK